MNSLLKTSNLEKYIIEPIKKNLDKRLKRYQYYDIGNVDKLITNNKVDIIAHQLELQFEADNSIFISWATIERWSQYSLSVSEISFIENLEGNAQNDKNWEDILGRNLKSFEVYGYKKSIIASSETNTGKIIYKTFYEEPHLLIFYFDNNKSVGVANFYEENDFNPISTAGDDIWIIFDKDDINGYIEKFNFQCIYM